MTFKRSMLSDGERADYDSIFERACLDARGRNRPAAEVAELLLSELADGAATGRRWCEWICEDAQLAGLRALGKAWQNERQTHRTPVGEVFMTRSNIARIKRTRSASVGPRFEPVLWEDLTYEQLMAKLREARAQRDSAAITVRDLTAAARIFEAALGRGECATLGDALRLGGYAGLNDFLASAAS